MRVSITMILLIAIGIGEARAQCSTTVHASSISIDTTLQVNASNNKYWLCDGDTLLLTGNRNDVWVEENAVFTINGDTNNIYLRKNAAITIAGVMNNVNYDVSITPTNNGSNTTLLGCNPIIFDYSSAPSTGCKYWIGIESHNPVKSATVYPNPANDFINVVCNGQVGNDVLVEIYDSMARLVSSKSVKESTTTIKFDVSDLKTGIYTAQVKSGNVISTATFTVQH